MKVKYATIAVTDMDESIKFYTEIMGFVVDNQINPFPGFTITFLKGEGNSMIELVKNVEEPKKGIFMVGLEVDDMDSTADELRSKGVEFTRGPIDVGDGAKIAFLKDPDGVEIELIQHKI